MDRPRFTADEMLGSLARWLRLMGYDTEYERDGTDTDILLRARAEGRVLLTRDKVLAERAGSNGLYVSSRDLEAQLEQVLSEFDLVFDEDLSRCTACNGQLLQITSEEAAEGVPEGALRSNDHFSRCGSCGKYYWKGSHWKNIRRSMTTRMGPGQDSSR